MTFSYQNKQLCVESIPLAELAEQYGTPSYVYSTASIKNQWHAFKEALQNYPHQICYAVKANSNLSILRLLATLGAGFDIVSGGELARVIAAGGDPQKTIFSGVGKQTAEIENALEADIYCFNVESHEELIRINDIARSKNKKARIAVRINPNIDAGTHPYISTGLKENKFGIAFESAIDFYGQAAQLSHIHIIGIGCHIGSQLTELQPFLDALDALLALIETLKKKNIALMHVDLGGGLGVAYQNENPPGIKKYIDALLAKIKNSGIKLILEPGRVLVADAGVLLTRIEYIKKTEHKNFAIIDAGMNDLLRPALYQAWQNILPVTENTSAEKLIYDVVGPVCETADFLGKDRELAIKSGDLLAVMQTGAYGFSMSSQYNTRPRAAEILVDGSQVKVIRQREAVERLWEEEVE